MKPSSSAFDHEAALLACARGERFALRSLYEHESRWLLGVALRIVRNRALAEDVLQEAFLKIWNGAATFDPSLGSARGWVFTVVRHCALNEARKAEREVPTDDESITELIDSASRQEFMSNAESRGESLDRCLQALDEPKRLCIVHAFVDGYTQEQIAQRTQTPLGTVKSWIRRGLLSLKECMS